MAGVDGCAQGVHMSELRSTDERMQPCSKGCGALVHHENVGFHVCLTAPVTVSFKLLTNGQDEEIDVMHIIVEAFKQLDGDQIGRTLDYLTRRYTRCG